MRHEGKPPLDTNSGTCGCLQLKVAKNQFWQNEAKIINLFNVEQLLKTQDEG